MMESGATHPALKPCEQGGGQHLPVELGFTSKQFSCSFPVAALLHAWWRSHAAMGTAASSESPAKGDTAVLGKVLPVVGSACLLQVWKWSCTGNSIVCHKSQAAEQRGIKLMCRACLQDYLQIKFKHLATSIN